MSCLFYLSHSSHFLFFSSPSLSLYFFFFYLSYCHSVSPFIERSLTLSIYLSALLCIKGAPLLVLLLFISFSFPKLIPMFLSCLNFCLEMYRSISLSSNISVYIIMYRSISLSSNISVYIIMYRSISLSSNISVYIIMYRSINLSSNISVYICIVLSIYQVIFLFFFPSQIPCCHDYSFAR